MASRLLRTSERTTFASCPQRWWWAYREGYRPIIEKPVLRFGTLAHRALELRYPPGIRRGPHPAKTFVKLYDKELDGLMAEGFRDEDGKWEDARDIGIEMFEEFIREFGKDSDYEVISSEQQFSVRIGKGIKYVGTVDGVWKRRKTGKILLKEWKTTDSFWTQHLELDEQSSSYWAFAPSWLRSVGLLLPGDTLSGILYTFLRRARPDKRPRNVDGHALNQDGSVSKRQPLPMFERTVSYRGEYERQMVRARALEQLRLMTAIDEGQASLIKTPGRFVCSTCPFRDPCTLHETGADYQPLFRSLYARENPYSAHEIEREGKES